MEIFKEFMETLLSGEPPVAIATPTSSLTAAEIHGCLQRLLGDSAHIINPALSEKHSPLLGGETQGIGVVAYLQAIRKACLTPSGAVMLSKPVVMICVDRTEISARDAKGAGSKAKGSVPVSRWKAVILLPANYRAVTGRSCANSQPLLYYFDPHSHQPDAIPEPVGLFGLSLSQGCETSVMLNGGLAPGRIRVEPVLPRVKFANGSAICCDARAVKEGGWWALSYALMAVFTGEPHFNLKAIPKLAQWQKYIQPYLQARPKVGLVMKSIAAAPTLQLKSSVAAPEASSSMPSKSEPAAVIPIETPQLASVKPDAAALPSTPLPEPKIALAADAAEGLGTALKTAEPELKRSAPRYSPAIQNTILRSYGLSERPRPDLSRDTSGQFEVYFYPEQVLNLSLFTQDNLAYWRATQGKIANRRVAFFLSQEPPVAIVAQLTIAPDNTAEALWQQYGKESDAVLLGEATFTDPSRRWYSAAQIMVLGMASTDGPGVRPFLTTLQAALSKALQISGPLALNFKAIPTKLWSDVVLLQDTLTMLSLGVTKEIAQPENLLVEHRGKLVEVFVRQLNSWFLDNAMLYKALTEELLRFTKFSLLNEQRQRYPETVHDRRQYDFHVKQQIYAQTQFTAKAIGARLSLADLCALLEKPRIEEWLSYLSSKSELQRLEIVRWEMTAASAAPRENWCNYLSRKAWDAAQYLYQYSWAGLLQTTVQGTAKAVLQDKIPSLAFSQGVTRTAEHAGQMLQRITHSSQFAARSAAGIRQFFAEYPLSRSLGLLGAGVGAGLQFMMGPADLLRVVAMVGGLQVLQTAVQSRRLREERAVLLPAALSPMAILWLCQCTVALTESFLSGHFAPALFALGTIGGSTAASAMAQLISPELAIPAADRAEERQSTLFVVALIGGKIGRESAIMLYLLVLSMDQRLLHREAAVELLSHLARDPRNNLESLRVTTPALRYSPALWGNSRNPIHLAWTSRNGASGSLDCEITRMPVLTAEGMVGLLCNNVAADLQGVLSLPAP